MACTTTRLKIVISDRNKVEVLFSLHRLVCMFSVDVDIDNGAVTANNETTEACSDATSGHVTSELQTNNARVHH